MANLHAVAEGLHIALFVSGVLSLFLRFYSRAIVIRKWGLDDTIAVATLVRASVVYNFFHANIYRRFSMSPCKQRISLFWTQGVDCTYSH